MLSSICWVPPQCCICEGSILFYRGFVSQLHCRLDPSQSARQTQFKFKWEEQKIRVVHLAIWKHFCSVFSPAAIGRGKSLNAKNILGCVPQFHQLPTVAQTVLCYQRKKSCLLQTNFQMGFWSLRWNILQRHIFNIINVTNVPTHFYLGSITWQAKDKRDYNLMKETCW